MLDTPPREEAVALIAALGALRRGLIFLAILLPLPLLLLGIFVGALALLARVTNVATWTVRAESADRVVKWRVSEPVRSRRKLRQVARTLERGREAAHESTSSGG
jgi:hypothetical protein